MMCRCCVGGMWCQTQVPKYCRLFFLPTSDTKNWDVRARWHDILVINRCCFGWTTWCYMCAMAAQYDGGVDTIIIGIAEDDAVDAAFASAARSRTIWFFHQNDALEMEFSPLLRFIEGNNFQAIAIRTWDEQREVGMWCIYCHARVPVVRHCCCCCLLLLLLLFLLSVVGGCGGW